MGCTLGGTIPAAKTVFEGSTGGLVLSTGKNWAPIKNTTTAIPSHLRKGFIASPLRYLELAFQYTLDRFKNRGVAVIFACAAHFLFKSEAVTVRRNHPRSPVPVIPVSRSGCP